MSTIALTCNHCGAPLEIPHEMRFLTCSHCGSRLEVKRSGSAVFTEVLERIEKQAEQIADGVETIQLQNELERVDREWEMERRSYLSVNKHGRESEPDASGILSGIILIGIGVLLIGGSLSSGNGAAAILGLPIIGFGVFRMVDTYETATRYAKCYENYQKRRANLVHELDQR